VTRNEVSGYFRVSRLPSTPENLEVIYQANEVVVSQNRQWVHPCCAQGGLLHAKRARTASSADTPRKVGRPVGGIPNSKLLNARVTAKETAKSTAILAITSLTTWLRIRGCRFSVRRITVSNAPGNRSRGPRGFTTVVPLARGSRLGVGYFRIGLD
jgi:hypothetical protein